MNELRLKASSKKKWYQTSGGIISLLILFFPVGLFLMWKHANWNKTAKLIITGIFAFFIIVTVINDNSTVSPASQPTTETSARKLEPTNINETNQETREMIFLREQSERSEQITREAVELVTEDKMSEVESLYNARWNELAKLRVEIMYDMDFTTSQKENIDKALITEQESISNILKKYEELY